MLFNRLFAWTFVLPVLASGGLMVYGIVVAFLHYPVISLIVAGITVAVVPLVFLLGWVADRLWP